MSKLFVLNGVFVVAGAPVLAVEKDVMLTQDPAQPGDPITYTITVSNLGESDAIDVHIVDTLPVDVIGASVDMTVTIAGNSSYQIIIPATISNQVTFGTTVTNTVYVYHVTGDIIASTSFDVVALVRVFLPLINRAP